MLDLAAVLEELTRREGGENPRGRSGFLGRGHIGERQCLRASERIRRGAVFSDLKEGGSESGRASSVKNTLELRKGRRRLWMGK